MSKAKGKGKAKAAAPEAAPAAAPEAAPAPAAASQLVTCRLGPAAPVGALVVGNARIERNRPGRIPRPEFERLKREYDLIEVEE